MKRKEHAITSATQFFRKNAGYSYDPKTQTPEQGQMECAEKLAEAEYKAREAGFSYNWSIDPYSDSTEFADGDAYELWQCAMYNAEGRLVNSLHGIDFGRDGSPFGDAYRRVVEAELAIDGMTNKPQ